MAGRTGLEPATSDEELKGSDSIYRLLENKAGKTITLKVGPNADGKDAREVKVTPTSSEQQLRHYAWVRRVCGLLLLGARRSHLLHSITPTVFGRASLLYGEGRRSSLLARRFFGGRFVGRPGVSARSRSMCAPQLAKAAASSGSRRDRL